MKIVFSFLFLCLHSITIAQSIRCGSDYRLQKFLKTSEKAIEQRKKLEEKTKNFTSIKSASLVIPVVVHIVYKNNSENISDNQIISQLDVLSKDFTRNNTDRFNTPSDFHPIVSNLQIEFCLAKQTPDGLPTNGIIRKETINNNFLLDENKIFHDSLGGSTAWNTEKYLNIWVCEIEDGILGWSQYPAGGNINTDGVVINYEHFGTIGTALSPYDLGRTATHEVGHWFNLYHLWGDSNCGDDFVSDTPEQEDANFGCKIHPNISCNNNGDMFMNYMDYTNDNCMNSFTHGQKNRVWSAISNYRNGLLNSKGCELVTIPNSDAGILDILQPNNQIQECSTPINPSIVLKNYGDTSLNSVIIKYNIDGSNYYYYSWNGNLTSGETDTIYLPAIKSTGTTHLLNIYSEFPNGSIDVNTTNDMKSLIFNTIDGENVNLSILTDNYGYENSWKLIDDQNNIIDENSSLNNNTLYNTKYCLDYGCYKFIITDSNGDGICCDYGNGYAEIEKVLGLNKLVSIKNFLFSDTANFCIGITSFENILKNQYIYPNPTTGNIAININEIPQNKTIFASIYNIYGQLVYNIETINNTQFDISNLNNGLYMIIVTTNKKQYIDKIKLEN